MLWRRFFPTWNAVRSRQHMAPYNTRIPLNRCFSSSNPNGDNGNLWFYIGGVLMGIVLAEQAFIAYKEREVKTLHEDTLTLMQQDANRHASSDSSPSEATLPTLFDCQVVEVHPNLDGVKMLRGVQKGDNVQVLTTGVGPDQAYHLCRMTKAKISANNPQYETSVGWYPQRFLKEID